MISDAQFYLDSSYEPQTNNFNFSNKQYQIIEDLQRGSYPGGMVVNFDMSALGTNNRYTNWGESMLVVPLVVLLYSSTALTSTTVNAFGLSLKNGYHHLINSLRVQISNNEVCNSQLLTNLKIHYDIVSSWSQDDVKTIGSVINFHGIDNPDSEKYVVAGTNNNNFQGLGLCNNSITASNQSAGGFTPIGGYSSYDQGNLSRIERMKNTSYDPSNIGAIDGPTTILNALTSSDCNSIGKNYVSNSSGGTTSASPIVFYITATIPLSTIHPLFKKLPLTKNIYMKIDLNLNTNITVSAGYSAAGLYTGFTVTGVAPTNPLMLSPLGSDATLATCRGLAPTAAQGNIIASIAISKNGTYQHSFTSCRIYVACYTLSPDEDKKYLATVPIKKVLYDDFMYSNANLNSIKPGTAVYNTQLFINIRRIRGILIIPQLSTSVHGAAVANLNLDTGGTLGSPMISPFSSSPGTCCPHARVNNFNVYVGGTQWFPENVNYGWQIYNNEIRKNNNTPFGNSLRGMASGLIDQHAWETNHGYIFVNLDRWRSLSDDNDPKTVGISFTNACRFTCDYHVFLIYQREIEIYTSTGELFTEK